MYGNVALSIVVVSTKKWYYSSLKKVLVFKKTYFKVEVLNEFKTSNNFHMTIFMEEYSLNILHEWAFSKVNVKIFSHLAAKFVQRSYTSFSIYLIDESIWLMNHLTSNSVLLKVHCWNNFWQLTALSKWWKMFFIPPLKLFSFLYIKYLNFYPDFLVM